MITAFILVVTKSGTEKNVVNALTDMAEVKEAKVVYGQYDIVVKVEIEDMGALNEFLLNKVRSVDGILDSSTLISAY